MDAASCSAPGDSAWRPLVVSDDPVLQHELTCVLRGRVPVDESAAASDAYSTPAILDRVRRERANLCLLDVSGPEERCLGLIRNLADHNLTVVVFHAEGDSELILRCLRAGASDFLSQTCEAAAVWCVLDELQRKLGRAEAEVPGAVSLVIPAKPNLGGTTLAINLARRVQPTGRKPILLADLDPFCADIGFHLRMRSGYTFLDAFRNWERMDAEFWKSLVVPYAGMEVLLSPEAMGSCDFAAPPAEEFVKLLRRHYAVGILDCPGLWTPWYSDLAAAADEVLLVVTGELTALHAAQRALEVMRTAGVDVCRIKLILNRFEPNAKCSTAGVESALKLPIFFTLPNEYEVVQQAILDRKTVPSTSRLGKSLDELSARLGHREAAVKKARSWPMFFSREHAWAGGAK